jgi:hypothetical protein
MDRMAQQTKQPGVLRELFGALGNDPFVIAECLSRPVLAERVAGDLWAQHKTARLESARSKELRSLSMPMMSGNPAYTLPEIFGGSCTDDTWTPVTTTNAPSIRAGHTVTWTGSEMIVWGGNDGTNYWNTGGKYNPSTDSWTATSTTNAPLAEADTAQSGLAAK